MRTPPAHPHSPTRAPSAQGTSPASEPAQRGIGQEVLIGLLTFALLLVPVALLAEDQGGAGARLALLAAMVVPPGLALALIQRRTGRRPDPMQGSGRDESWDQAA